MAITHVDLFTHSQLLEKSDTEVAWRNSAARAYYAAYHRAQFSVGYCPDNSHLAMGSHERLADRFILHKTTPAKAISYMLSSMKKLRHIADYENEDEFPKTLATGQLTMYLTLVSKLETFDSSQTAKTA